PVQFEVLRSFDTPIIDYIDPASGPVGQYVTLHGSNFGSTPAAVKFINVSTGAMTLADINFPPACATDYWHDTYVFVKVPSADLGDYKVKVVRDNKESNGVDFKINIADLKPGICHVDPDNGPAGTPVDFFGERFGSSQGAVRFFDRQSDGAVSLWSDNHVKVLVPLAAKTGWAQVVNIGGLLSNDVLFQVGFCSANTCGEGQQCCSTGSCRATGTCVVVAPMCQYSWVFSTGQLIRADVIIPPHVLDHQLCSDGTSQSPSPYKNITDACLNSQISALFDRNMDEATFFDGGVIMTQCNTGGNFNSGACSTTLNANLTVINLNTAQEGFILKPAANLLADTWYQVKIDGSKVKSSTGDNADTYTWNFKARSASGLCSLDSIQILPKSARAETLNQNIGFDALPQAANCNILNPNGYTWSWSTDPSSRAKVDTTTTSHALVTALAETEPANPVAVVGGVITESKAGQADLTIDFSNPQITSFWPACDQACVNAGVGAKFSQPMDPAYFTSSNVRLFACADGSTCLTLTPIPILISYAADQQSLIISPAAFLNSNVYYRALIMAGASGVRSTSQLPLVDLNFASQVGKPNDSFSWTFKTQSSGALCAVDRVTVGPANFTMNYIDQTQEYTAQAFGRPDACSASGQALDTLKYNWAWLSTVDTVASITKNKLPLATPDTNVDSVQTATGKLQGATKIQANAQGKIGEGQLELKCGYQNDAQCQALDPSGAIKYALGKDTCCWSRPKVQSVTPSDGAFPVCRNPYIAIDFNQLMDAGTLETNIFLDLKTSVVQLPPGIGISLAGQCPAVTGIALLPDGWCRWPTKISSVTVGSQTRAFIELKADLLANSSYRIKITGDPNLADNQKVGVQNLGGVVMDGDYQVATGRLPLFTTGQSICEISSVQIQVQLAGQAPDVVTRDVFKCAGRNDCPSDMSNAVGNQHSYIAQALDSLGNPVLASFAWSKSGGASVDLSAKTGQQIFVTANPANGEGNVTVLASGPRPEYGTASRTQNVSIFLCENPWPDLTSFPYTDNDTNFS
ncbi:Ig-like domain-containing protein, partial [Candidatus Uhrbacteria bacterium]|nr:Ig-like domain-containing protein [Candidatus Uhrbacteria bacterium]